MSLRHRSSSNSDGPQDESGQRVLDFGARKPAQLRDDKALLSALTTVLSVLVRSGDIAAVLRESFTHAMRGLAADKGLVAQLAEGDPPQLTILCAQGLTPENEAACQALRSSPGISPSLIRRALESGRPSLLENSQVNGIDQTASLNGGGHSVVCAPVTDSLSHAPVAVLYFQNDVHRAFDAEDLEWLTAYATVLGQALTLHLATQRQLRELKAAWKREQDGLEILGSSEATRTVIETLNTYLPSTCRPDAPPILITGESGTGKELVARYLHHYSEKRARGPFQACNCATLRGDLAEARLFGHVRGAFTGAIADAAGLFRAADKGVLFLDEIGELPWEAQGYLLRVLETRRVQPLGDTKEFPVDVQLVVATNRRLEDEVAARQFREDLWHRLNGLRVELVPLRDPARIADIKALLSHFLALHQRVLKKPTQGLTSQALRALLQYEWRGNVRELNNVCLTLVTHAAPGSPIGMDDIAKHRPDILAGPKNLSPEAFLEDDSLTWGDAIREFRRKLIMDRLRRHGSAAAAAHSLGISEPTFYRQLAEAKRRP